MTHKKIQIDDTIYEANLDFRVAIECSRIAEDNTIGNYERLLGIICTLFGPDAINNPRHYEKLLKWALNYLSFGKKVDKKVEPDMDLIEDKKYIKSSFKYDYKYDPYEKEFLSWEDFFNDLNNLSNNEFGSCCILNRVRNLRNYDTKKIKDPEERKKIEEAKRQVALKKKVKEKHFTEEEIKNMQDFWK